MQVGKWLAGGVETVYLGKSLQPGLPALLRHDAVASPRGILIVEAFISRPNGLLVRERHAGLIKAGQVWQPVVACRRHYPGIAPVAKARAEAVIILKNQRGLDAHARQR